LRHERAEMRHAESFTAEPRLWLDSRTRMSSRPKLPVLVEEKILTASRRRCALCYGLTRDTSIKRGQIAHLDGDVSNNTPDNLAFLCLPHHEEYDSRSRQAKGITPAELGRYRDELYKAISTAWNKPATFTPAIRDPRDAIAGHYVRQGSQQTAEFQISHLGNGVMQVSGLAIWGSQPSTHTGSVDFVGDLRRNRLYFADRMNDRWYNLELTLDKDHLRATEVGSTGYHGTNVSFDGTYHRLSS